MHWNEENTNLLIQWWKGGMSYGRIAEEFDKQKAQKLGRSLEEREKTSRNSVAGKVTKLKEAGRLPKKKPVSGERDTKKQPKRGKRSSHPKKTMGRPKTASFNSAPQHDPRPEPEPVAELYISPEKRIGLLALTEHTCKWPIGDPLSDDFYFCGQDSEEDKPYCEFHSRRAYVRIERKGR